MSQTITGELRKWRLLARPTSDGGMGVVVGKMYNDVHDIWEDGDDAVIHIRDWIESANFYLAVTHHSCIKCPKDEESMNGNSS